MIPEIMGLKWRVSLPELLNKILKFPAVRKLFPRAKLMEHVNIDIQDHL